jgi:hypothetical protein
VPPVSFFAQHGYGKSDKLDVLAAAGVLGGVILSPADETIDALQGTVRAMAGRNVETLLDPQTYIYNDPERRRSVSRGSWPGLRIDLLGIDHPGRH